MESKRCGVGSGQIENTMSQEYNSHMELSEADKHALNLGKLLGNYQSLEFLLRAFLLKEEELAGMSYPESGNLHRIKEGETLQENAFTNYDTLGQLIAKYNDAQDRCSEVYIPFSIKDKLCFPMMPMV